jgi:hypothetical protein
MNLEASFWLSKASEGPSAAHSLVGIHDFDLGKSFSQRGSGAIFQVKMIIESRVFHKSFDVIGARTICQEGHGSAVPYAHQVKKAKGALYISRPPRSQESFCMTNHACTLPDVRT